MNTKRKSLKAYGKVILCFLLSISLNLSFSYKTYASSINSDYNSFVMAPLEKIEDWNEFKNQLATLKDNGVYALTTDIWWGDVEGNGDNEFDWSYYKKYADTVRDSGLKWVPILSTHKCGENVGDPANIPLPSWLWSKDTAENMQFKDESGNFNNESLSPWWSGTTKQYDELYASFASNFSNYKDIIVKIYLSGGAAGELRFPSYNSKTYPKRGKLQCYSQAAEKDFQNEMKHKYSTIALLNNAWGTTLPSFDEITPPTDGDNFFINGYKSKYGEDFLTWYQGVLSRHLGSIAAKAHKNFDSVFNVRIGAKIAGIHWLMNSPTMPHAAEYSAGYYNYSTLLDQFKISDLDLTFTCLEMDDSKINTNPYYSAPKSLVIEVATLASSKGIKHYGENGLPICNNNQSYQNLGEMLFNYKFSGFALLRLSNIVDSNGNATPEMKPFKDTLIMKPVPVNFTVNDVNTTSNENMYITGDRWEMSNWTTGLYPLQLKNNNGKFEGTTYLGAGTTYQFKAIKKDSIGNITWESGNNKSYTVPYGGGSYTWNLNN